MPIGLPGLDSIRPGTLRCTNPHYSYGHLHGGRHNTDGYGFGTPIQCKGHHCRQHTQIPLLLIHGEDDRYVPCSMSRKILEACKGPVTSAFFPGAGHGLSYVADSPRYEALTIEFLENVLK